MNNALSVSRAKNLDVIRGLACLMVVVYHAREIVWIGGSDYFRTTGIDSFFDLLLTIILLPFTFGGLGVSVFFVLSGYLIHGSVWRSAKSFNVSKFYRKRLFRIYPVLLFSLLFTYLIDFFSLINYQGEKISDISTESFLCNIVALQGLACKPFGSNGPLWSLAIEIHFYIFYPLAYIFRKKYGINFLMLILIIASAFGVIVGNKYGGVNFLQYYVFWWFGGYAAERVDTRDVLKGSSSFFIRSVFTMSFLCACVLILYKFYYESFAVSAFGASIMLYGLGTGQINVPELWWGRWIRSLSVYSYSAYAIHVPVLLFVYSVILGTKKSPYSIAVVLSVCFCLIFSYLFYTIFERPFLRFSR
jgi:peptidoglycan/LPS O-acetylase OafA/YrhL